MKLLAALVVAAYGQDYDFYSSGEAYRFGSVGDFSHTQQNIVSGTTITATDGIVMEDGSVSPIDATNPYAVEDAHDNSQFAHIHGIYADSVRYLSFGHGGNRRYCHTTRNNRAVYNWTSHRYGGYFGEGRNFMECMGEELYCFIEERAHYGQIIGITAGCEQMMNHPSVTLQDQQALISSTGYTQINAIKNNYNQEAARGGANRHGFFTYYGLGGCLAMPAQNGHHYTEDRKRPPGRGDSAGEMEEILWDTHRTGVDSPNWRSYKWLNYYRNYHGGYGQNQCLRFPKQRLDDTLDTGPTNAVYNPTTGAACAQASLTTQYGADADAQNCGARVDAAFTYTSPGSLLPFGVSVCRACCVAQFHEGVLTANLPDFDVIGSVTDKTEPNESVAKHLLCNYAPDSDWVIVDNTDEQFEELIPRFDMAGPAYNAFQQTSEINRASMPDHDNNLFVHGSWCSEPGPARGCAKIPVYTGSMVGLTNNYLWGRDLSSDVTASALEWRYTCSQTARVGGASKQSGGLQPINAQVNRDWCPGRPWLAKSFNDANHTKPTAGANHNIIGK